MTSLDPRIADALARLPDYLGQHVLVSAVALALGLAVSIPLAIAAANRPRLAWPVEAAASLIQTIPGLALLALFYPLLLGLAALSQRVLGVSFSALGFLPSVMALALYSMLPALRGTLIGLHGVDAGLKEAAKGLGMTARQSLWMVELPLALPVIMGGVRTAAVWVIGAATLATPIGQTSLGNYIFTGLQTQNWVFVLFGCAAAAALAFAIDQLLALMERGAAARRPSRIGIGAAGLAAVLVISLWPIMGRSGGESYKIGAKPFTEQQVLGALIGQRIADAGGKTTQRDGLGSAIVFSALEAGDIDAYVEYSGTLWTNMMGRRDAPPRDELLAETKSWLDARGVTLLGALGFENAYALVTTRERAQRLGLRSVADIARRSAALSIAGDYEFFGRPEWTALQQAYGLKFRAERQMQPVFMYEALLSGDVDVIAGYTSDGQIAQNDLVVLEDPRHAVPPYDAILLISPKRKNDETLRTALTPLVGAIKVEAMREANLRAERTEDKQTPDQAAAWLWGQVRKGE